MSSSEFEGSNTEESPQKKSLDCLASSESDIAPEFENETSQRQSKSQRLDKAAMRSNKRKLRDFEEDSINASGDDEYQPIPSSSTPVEKKRKPPQFSLSQFSDLMNATVPVPEKRRSADDKKLELLDKKMDFLIKQNELILAELRNSNRPAKKDVNGKVDVPSHIRVGIHDGYKSGEKEKGLRWITKDGTKVLKSTSEENKQMTEFVFNFAKELYHEIEDGVIRVGIQRYFESIKQKDQKERDGKLESHKKTTLQNSRKQRKLKSRKAAVSCKKSWDAEKKQKVLKALDISLMSSEEEMDSDGEIYFKIKPLPWRSEEFNTICKELDEKNEKQKSARSRRQSVKIIRGAVSSNRPQPQTIKDGNKWVVKK